MPRPLVIFALLLTSAGCSQRAPWRVVADPQPEPGAVWQREGTSRALPSASATSGASLPALAMEAVVTDATPVDNATASHLSRLQFPVPAVESLPLVDSFSDQRDGGARTHNATDIMAPKGTAIVAADDGHILRLSTNPRGGITVYATDLEEHFVYYYAHLERYYKRLYAGKPITRGDTLGFVGSSGNAVAAAPHLHFQVMRMPANKRHYWEGDPINAFPYLRDIAAQATTTAQLSAP